MAKKEKDKDLLSTINNKVDILIKFGDKIKDYELDENGLPIPDVDEDGDIKLDSNGDIIYKKKPVESKSSAPKKYGFAVRYKTEEERAKMQALATKYNDAVNEKSSFNEYVRKVTTEDVYKEISDLKRQIKELEKALGMTLAEYKKSKKKKQG